MKQTDSYDDAIQMRHKKDNTNDIRYPLVINSPNFITSLNCMVQYIQQ